MGEDAVAISPSRVLSLGICRRQPTHPVSNLMLLDSASPDVASWDELIRSELGLAASAVDQEAP